MTYEKPARKGEENYAARSQADFFFLFPHRLNDPPQITLKFCEEMHRIAGGGEGVHHCRTAVSWCIQPGIWQGTLPDKLPFLLCSGPVLGS